MLSSNIPNSVCTGNSTRTSDCGITPQNEFTMIFSSCQIAKIESVSPLNVSYDTIITINGSGFSSNQCENEVYIGGVNCPINSSSTNQITCILGPKSGLLANTNYPVEVSVKNKGNYWQFSIQSIFKIIFSIININC